MYSHNYFDDDTSSRTSIASYILRLTLYLLTTFRRRRNLFFKVRLQIFQQRTPASGRWLQCPPICRCIINLHQISPMGCGLMMHQPICTHSQNAGDGRHFRVTACNLSKVANCSFSTSVPGIDGIRPTGRYRPLHCLMFNTVVIISTTTQVQSDIDRIVHFWLTWYLLTAFWRRRSLFFKVRLQIFRRRVPASGRCLQCPPIRRCIINLHRSNAMFLQTGIRV